MKPTKNKTSKSKVVEVSTSTIKSYFKAAVGRADDTNVCIERENERKTPDNRAVYVQALKNRLKCKIFSVYIRAKFCFFFVMDVLCILPLFWLFIFKLPNFTFFRMAFFFTFTKSFF